MLKINKIIVLIIIIAIILGVNLSYATFITGNVITSRNEITSENEMCKVSLTSDSTSITRGEKAIIHVSIKENSFKDGICEISGEMGIPFTFNSGHLLAGEDWILESMGAASYFKMITKNKQKITTDSHVLDIELGMVEQPSYGANTIRLFNLVASDGVKTMSLEDTAITIEIVHSETNEEIEDNTHQFSDIGIICNTTTAKKGDNIKLTVSITENIKNTVITENYKIEGIIRYSDKVFNNINLIKNSLWNGEISHGDGVQYPRIWSDIYNLV